MSNFKILALAFFFIPIITFGQARGQNCFYDTMPQIDNLIYILKICDDRYGQGVETWGTLEVAKKLTIEVITVKTETHTSKTIISIESSILGFQTPD